MMRLQNSAGLQLTYCSGGIQGEADGKRSQGAVAGLCNCRRIDDADQHKGHDALPPEELACCDSNPLEVGEAPWACPVAGGDAWHQEALQRISNPEHPKQSRTALVP